MGRTESYIAELKSIFAAARDKHEANFRSTDVLARMSGDSVFMTEILQRHLERDGTLNTLHYPVVAINIELNEYFGLVANCWIPLPDRNTEISTKAIHHHGDMLLSTVTAFGSGYEHWTFETPSVVDAGKEIYELKPLSQEDHPRHHVAFVDHHIAHLPLYPSDLTVTFALWSSRFPKTWRDKLKRVSILQNNSTRLRKLATKVGLASQLELKVVEYFDFYPTCEGFKGMKERKEFPLTTNSDYLASLFCIIQGTSNDALAPVIHNKLERDHVDNRTLVNELLQKLESGEPIEGRLSPEHYNVTYANFSKNQILEAVAAQNQKSAASRS
jgi:hypothetical protein